MVGQNSVSITYPSKIEILMPTKFVIVSVQIRLWWQVWWTSFFGQVWWDAFGAVHPKSKSVTFLLGEPSRPYSSPTHKVGILFIFLWSNTSFTIICINFNSSLILHCVYVADLLPSPSIAFTGSPALCNFLITASIGGDIVSCHSIIAQYHL